MVTNLLKKRATADPIIPTEEHPTLLAHRQQRETLAALLADLHVEIATLAREREQGLADDRDAEVRELLQEPVTVDRAAIRAQVARVDAAITLAQSKVAPLKAAIERLDARESELRAQVDEAVRQQVEKRAAGLVLTMAKHLQAAAAVNAELVALERLQVGGVPVPSWPELTTGDYRSKLPQWLQAARAAGLDI